MNKLKVSRPQRKPHKVMTPMEMLNKAAYGTHKPLTPQQQRQREWEGLVK